MTTTDYYFKHTWTGNSINITINDNLTIRNFRIYINNRISNQLGVTNYDIIIAGLPLAEFDNPIDENNNRRVKTLNSPAFYIRPINEPIPSHFISRRRNPTYITPSNRSPTPIPSPISIASHTLVISPPITTPSPISNITITINSDQDDQDDQQDNLNVSILNSECSVCYQNFITNTNNHWLCSHYNDFCSNCINTWSNHCISNDNPITCPICRSNI